MNISLLMLLLLSLGLTACGDDNDSTSVDVVEREEVPIAPPVVEVPIPEDEVSGILANQSMSCASLDGGACPAGIARLFMVNREDNSKSGVCTGFMIDRNTLITNYHCLSEQTICESTYIAIHTGNGNYQQARCSRIRRAAQDLEDYNDPRRRLDVTVMDIEGSYSGQTFDLASAEVEDGDPMTLWVVDHTGLDTDGNLLESRITEFECGANIPSDIASLKLLNCPTVAGNSGSPVLNASGNVVGVMWGGTATFDSSLDLASRRLEEVFAAATQREYFFRDPPPIEETPDDDGDGGEATTGGGSPDPDDGSTAGGSTGETTGETTGGTTGETTGGTTGDTTGDTTGGTTGEETGGTTSGGTSGETAGGTDGGGES